MHVYAEMLQIQKRVKKLNCIMGTEKYYTMTPQKLEPEIQFFPSLIEKKHRRRQLLCDIKNNLLISI